MGSRAIAASKGASFDPEESARLVDPPPVLFKTLTVSCPECHIHLVHQRYAFFPSTLYIEGHCVRCDERRAMFFAPEPHTYADAQPARLAPDLEAKVLDFVAYLSGQEGQSGLSPEDTTPRAGTAIDEGSSVTSYRGVESPSDGA